MDDNSPNLQELELKLSDLAVAVRTEDTAEVWKLVESTAHAIANGLRVRHGPGCPTSHSFIPYLSTTISGQSHCSRQHRPRPDTDYTCIPCFA